MGALIWCAMAKWRSWACSQRLNMWQKNPCHIKLMFCNICSSGDILFFFVFFFVNFFHPNYSIQFKFLVLPFLCLGPLWLGVLVCFHMLITNCLAHASYLRLTAFQQHSQVGRIRLGDQRTIHESRVGFTYFNNKQGNVHAWDMLGSFLPADWGGVYESRETWPKYNAKFVSRWFCQRKLCLSCASACSIKCSCWLTAAHVDSSLNHLIGDI